LSEKRSIQCFEFISYFSPSTTTEVHRSYLDSEYHAAERLGTEISGSCHLLYSECEVGLLDFISRVE